MARPISTGNISFGLVSIPVRMYPTIDTSSNISFNLLDGTDHSRLKQQYINATTGEIVERKEMVKGYEFAKGQYVVMTDDEIKALSERASPSIEITEFVPLHEVEPLFFDKAYFMGPETGSERAYRLLAEAMVQTGQSALARYAARGKQYLVLLRPYENGIIMQQLFYADEIRDFSELPVGEDVELKPGELDLAIQLIRQIANEKFEPQKYEDEVRKRVWATIEQKIEGREVTEVEDEAPKAQIIDLMEALKASLGSSAGNERKPARRASGKAEVVAKAPAKRKAAGK